MAKYSIEEVKSRVSLEEILDRYGWETRRKGRYIMVLCKFHNDTALGSAMIYPDSPDRFTCFTCGRSYSIFDVYMYENNCGFYEALEGLAKDYGIEGQKESRRCPFTRKELEEIGLCQRNDFSGPKEEYVLGFAAEDGAVPKGCRAHKETFCENPYAVNPFELDYFYRVKKGTSQMEHIHQLFREDKGTFISLVKAKATEAEDRHTKNYLFLQAISRSLEEKGAESHLTDELMFASLHGMYTARKILATLKRL